MNLKAHKLYILSGVQASGKSSFLQKNIEEGNIDSEMVVSTDAIRVMLLGTSKRLEGNKIVKVIHENANPSVFAIVNEILKAKLKEKQTIFLDATNINDEERARYVSLAANYGVESEILIFDVSLEQCKKQNLERSVTIREKVLEEFQSRFQMDSKYPFRLIKPNFNISLLPNIIHDKKVDVVGDTHGLFSQFLKLIEKAGYEIKNGVPVHPENRKLCFVGDFIDRGEESVQMLLFVKKAVEHGHYAIMGNHEMKLIRNIEREPGTEPRGSHAVLKTYSDLMKANVNEKEILKFLKSLPGYYIHKGHVICHANINHFDFKTTPFTTLVYGSSGYEDVDTDSEYEALYNKGVNIHPLIRGHVKSTTKEPLKRVVSLEEEQAFGGYLTLLPMDKFNGNNYNEVVVREKTNFNYSEILKKNTLNFNLKNLEKDKLVTSRPDDSGLLRIVKYSKKVFFDNLWHVGGHPLMKARGIVMNCAGEIVQHPFDKVFNYGENGAGHDIPDDEIVQYVEKVNGFLGNITLNPYTGKLLITTTGSFDSEFVGFIKDFIDHKQEGMLKQFLSKNDVTLSFEVVHPNDPHIIEYSAEEKGLYLIGVRGKKETDTSWEESAVDEVAQKLGFRRAFHGEDTFGNVKAMVRTSKLEGFMIRRFQEDGSTLTALKFKTPFYSTTKFVGRMNPKSIAFMYNAPEKFKEKIGEEEFFVLVDIVTSTVPKEVFLSMSNDEKVVLVRKIVNDLIK